MALLNLTEAQFQTEVLDETIPVLVDFWAEWCGPCKMVAPILEELASQYQGKVKIVKINIDQETGLAMRFAIRSIPTLLLFRNGQPQGQILGAVPKTKLIEFLDQNQI